MLTSERLSQPRRTAAVLVAGAALFGCVFRTESASPSDAGPVAGAPTSDPVPIVSDAGAARAAGSAICTTVDGGAYAAGSC